ncbi:putative RNA recognition motif domain, nucleotide-binding alpha-beta plait domain superfamily [Helianthus annuus]|nr:putative RNA recognition motif domain, nucleotide-binding alpha-beta plait domain superfamily [Helianthus annuus]
MEADDEGWETQNRKRKGGGAGAVFHPDITKFFVTNIPQGCRPWDLANAFRGFGEIAGAFIAKKKDKEGRIFGFVSFRGVRDQKLKQNMSKVKLGGNKLLVNVALFARENVVTKPTSSVGGGGRSKGSGQYAGQEGVPYVKGSKPVKDGVSFLDILTNRTRDYCEEDVLIVDPAISSLSSLSGRAVVGRSLGFSELNNLKSSLLVAGFLGATIQYLGGLSVLISFESEESSNNFLLEKGTWSRWFSSLSPWIGQALPYERFAWVIVHGVPPHLVSRKVFDMIGGKYGKVIHHSQFLETDGDLSYDRLGILTDSGNRINGTLNLSWQDKRYKVWAVEENDSWIPDFLDDVEGSVLASSELGDSANIPANEVASDREDVEAVDVSKEEGEKKSDNFDSPNGVHVPMQNLINGDVPDPKEGDEQSLGSVGPNSFSNIHADPLFSQGVFWIVVVLLILILGSPLVLSPPNPKDRFLCFEIGPFPLHLGLTASVRIRDH